MKYLLTFSLFLTCFLLRGQSPYTPVFCGNELFSDIVRTYYPELDQAFRTTFENAKHAPVSRSIEVLTIPVVVHVVWNDSSENLEESLIQEQIDILNEDYGRRNADTSELRTLFHNSAQNPGIHFELLEIVRVRTDRLFEIDFFGSTLLPELKQTSEGGSDARDTESYMNIWITKIQPIEFLGIIIGQILGFAYPPNGLDHWPDESSAPSDFEDGVVLDYRMIGRNNPFTVENPATGEILTVKGRTATHEVGHYLGLRHIWGDGDVLGPNNCAQSDGIDDTPFASTKSIFDCDTSKNSCTQIEPFYNEDMPDMVENFMDYARDDCMNMFTIGQVNIMRNVLFGPRNGLLNHVSSVNDQFDQIHFSISPNPTNGRVKINFSVAETTELTIRISDIGGHLTLANNIYQYLPGDHEVGMNIEGFAKGIYFVELRTKEGVGVKKIILGHFD